MLGWIFSYNEHVIVPRQYLSPQWHRVTALVIDMASIISYIKK